MPVLLVQYGQTRYAGQLTGRVLIGRKEICAIAIADPAISRIHAWIEPKDGRWQVGTTGGVNGVLVNGQPIEHLRQLADRDTIDAGPVRMIFSLFDKVPRGIQVVTFRQANEGGDASGRLVFCSCGTPTWVIHGKSHRCVFCSEVIAATPAPVEVPEPASPAAQTAPATATAQPASGRPAAPATTCGICQCAITRGQATHQCPDCQSLFHQQCWVENKGCCTYGCPQVGCLDQHSDEPARSPSAPVFNEAAPPVAPSYDYLLLTVSALATVLGLLAFGIPAAVVALIIAWFMWRRKSQSSKILLISLLLCLAGIIGGLAASYYWWMR